MQNKTLFESKYDCCGCTACYTICPVKAIRMTADEEGFLYPRVDETLCVNCHRCETVCPLRAGNGRTDPLEIYGAINRNETVRENSSSGGIFSLLADYVQSQGGVVYGAAYDEAFHVRHMRAATDEEWKKFCVSKYVQSNMSDMFRLVKQDLLDDRMVLFTGTPCQIDGLKRTLKDVRSDNLITCDIICHGTPSPKIWEDYLQYLSRYTGKTIGQVSFRDKKRLGWHNSTLTIWNTENQILLSETQRNNFFFQLFVCHIILRPSCHRCQYASFHRPGDFTLGDFWGIERNFSKYDDDKGVSLVMVHTERGEKIWQEIQSRTESFLVTKEQCVQPNLVAPSKENPNREDFWRWYGRYGFRRTGQRMGYFPVGKRDKLLLFLYRVENKLCRLLKK